MTTENSRANALTADAVMKEARERVYRDSDDDATGNVIWFAEWICDQLAAAPASQPAAAPIATHIVETEWPVKQAGIPHPSDKPTIVTCACGYSIESSCNALDPTCSRNTSPLPADERAAFEAHLIDTYGVVQDDDPAIERVKRDWTAGWQAARATSANETGAEGETCRTCSGRGMIGGPSYYAPDEGGEPCPDCAATQPAQADARVGLTADQREVILMAIGWHQYGSSVRDVKYAEALRALLDDDRA